MKKMLLVLLGAFGLIVATTLPEVASHAVPAFSVTLDPMNQASPHEVVYKPIKTQLIRVTRQTENELEDDFVSNILAATVRDLEMSDQFDVDVKKMVKVPTRLELTSLGKNGVDLVLVIEDKLPKDNDHVDFGVTAWKTKKLKTVFNKNACFEKKNAVLNGHCLSREVMGSIGGNAEVCLTTLAYCVSAAPHTKKICVSDYAGMFTKTVLSSGVNVAPSFHTTNPNYIFFSELATGKSRGNRSSNKLKMLNLVNGSVKVCCDYPGLNMQCKVTNDGSKAVLCMSGGQGNTEIFMYDQSVCNRLGKKVFKQLTFNGGTNCSASPLDNGDVIFCSDYEGRPQIYYLDMRNKKTLRITNGKGYCAAPSYCKKTRKLVFTRNVGQTYQLFTINMDEFFEHKKVTEQQLTFGIGDKNDPVVSPDGSSVAFVYDLLNEFGMKVSQIGVMNMYSKRLRLVTSGAEPKSFPAWTSGVGVLYQ